MEKQTIKSSIKPYKQIALPDNFPSEVILGHDVPTVGLGQGLEHAGLGHQGAGVDELLQHTRVGLLGQREVQDRQLVPWQPGLLLCLAGEYSTTKTKLSCCC